MAEKIGHGYIGNFLTLEDLQDDFPAYKNIGRTAHVGPPNALIPYFSDGSFWQQVNTGVGGGGSDMLFYVSERTGLISNDSGFDSYAALVELENDAYLAALALNTQAVIVPDGQFYISRTWRVRDRVSVVGLSETESGISLLETGFEGEAIITSVPVQGRVNTAIIQRIGMLSLDGNRVGLYQGTGVCVEGSNQVTGFAATNGWIPKIGDLLEGCGLRLNSYITGVSGTVGNYTLTLNLNAQYDNTNAGDPTLDNNNFVRRDGYLTTGSGTAGTYILTVASVAGLKIGMRGLGDNLEPDAENLNPATRITAINTLTNQVTISRKIGISGGSYNLLFWEEVMGLFCENADTAPGYNSNLKYCAVHVGDIQIFQCSGDGMVVRGGRNASHFDRGRIASCFGFGAYIVPSDCWGDRFSIGESWKSNLCYVAGATPRFRGEYYSNNNPAWPSVLFRGAKEMDLADCDITGTIEIRGANTELLPAISIHKINQKWSKRQRHPDDTFPSCYVRVSGTAWANVMVGCIKGEADGLPRFLVHRDGGGGCEVSHVLLETTLGATLCPFTEAISNTPETVQIFATDPTTGRKTFGHYSSGIKSRSDGVAMDTELIGGRLENTRLSGSALALTNATAAAVNTLVLTPGHYEVYGVIQFTAPVAATGTRAQASINSSVALVTQKASSYWQTKQAFTGVSNELFTGSLGPIRVVVPIGGATLYLVGHCNFTGGSVSAYGDLIAQRVG